MIQKSYDGKASLYLIPTPIGNMEDITIRSLNTLKEVEFILCEDTRVTSKLLNYFDIKKPLVRCDEYSQEKVKEKVLEALRNNKNIGLVSDAGSPIISDPGYIVSKYVVEEGFNVIALPGATAFVPALSVSEINPAPFIFYGFLNAKSSKEIKELKILKDKKETLIFYESPNRLVDTLNNMLEVFGDRKIAVCREISKIHEEVVRGTITDCLKSLTTIKGEIVIVVEGNNEVVDYSDLDIIEHVNLYIAEGKSNMEAIKIVAKERNIPKSVVYKEYNKK